MRKTVFSLLLLVTTAAAVQAQGTITVAKDGTGDYTTIQEAIDAAPDGDFTTIYVKAGTYAERVVIGSKQRVCPKQLSLIGDGADKTIITSDLGKNPNNTSIEKTAALAVYANDFYAEGITLRNSSGKAGGQALALFVSGDRQTYYRCHIRGYQDTHRTKKQTRSYFKECLIEGATDYIYAGGTAWFERCTLNCIGNGYITAPEDITIWADGPSGQRLWLGFIFNECHIKADGIGKNSMYLGRPWGSEKCGSIFLNCTLDDCIRPEGWTTMGGNTGERSFFAEYQSRNTDGTPADVSHRIGWSRQLSEADYHALMTWESVDSVFMKRTNSDVPFRPEAAIALNRQITIDDYAPVEQRLLAFPTARGFGKFASGGRGGKVVEVTNLEDSGEGSLRWALTEAGLQDATIVFRVSGTITLKSDIRAKLRNVTIAGQTAPGTGIVFRGGKLNLGGSNNFIMRNIRGRIGLKDDNTFIKGGSIGIENANRFIIDHCCFGWSGEENMTVYDNHFTTVQWTIVHEGLYDAGHQKGNRGYGDQWGGSPATFHHNLLAHNFNRSSRINGASNANQDRNVFVEYYNNVNYNWGKKNSCYGCENEAGPGSTHECNFVGNYYKPGPSTPSGSYFMQISNNRSGKTSTGPSLWYFHGNKMEGNPGADNDNWKAVNNNTQYTVEQLRRDTLLFPSAFYPANNAFDYNDYMTPTESADAAYANVLARVGTIRRDVVEQRIVDEVATKTAHYKGSTLNKAGFIDSPADAEGWPTYDSATPYVDNDHDGMDDAWEREHGLDPTDGEDGKRVYSAEGYTALEIFLNSLMGENIPISTGIVTAQHKKEAKSVKLYSLNGTLMKQQTDGNAIDLSDMPRGLYIAKTQNDDRTVETRKMLKK